MAPNEAELVRQAQSGDSRAFEALVLAHQDYVYNLAYRVVGNREEAEDLAQDSFVRAWQALPRFRGDCRFSTWLYRIVTNLCFNRLPGLRRELTILGDGEASEDVAEGAISVPDAVETTERRTWLHRQIGNLPEAYRLLITLRYQQDLPYEEIASITGFPVGTVKTGLFRAKDRLRKALVVEQEAVI